MSKNFKVGQKWVTRDGRTAEVLRVSDGTVYPVVALVEGEIDSATFNLDGMYWSDGDTDDRDLLYLSAEGQLEGTPAGTLPKLNELGEWKYTQGGFELHIDGDIYFGDTPTKCAARYLEAHYSEQNLTVSFTELAEDGV